MSFAHLLKAGESTVCPMQKDIGDLDGLSLNLDFRHLESLFVDFRTVSGVCGQSAPADIETSVVETRGNLHVSRCEALLITLLLSGRTYTKYAVESTVHLLRNKLNPTKVGKWKLIHRQLSKVAMAILAGTATYPLQS